MKSKLFICGLFLSLSAYSHGAASAPLLSFPFAGESAKNDDRLEPIRQARLKASIKKVSWVKSVDAAGNVRYTQTINPIGDIILDVPVFDAREHPHSVYGPGTASMTVDSEELGRLKIDVQGAIFLSYYNPESWEIGSEAYKTFQAGYFISSPNATSPNGTVNASNYQFVSSKDLNLRSLIFSSPSVFNEGIETFETYAASFSMSDANNLSESKRTHHLGKK